jgi:hypothetical protein
MRVTWPLAGLMMWSSEPKSKRHKAFDGDARIRGVRRPLLNHVWGLTMSARRGVVRMVRSDEAPPVRQSPGGQPEQRSRPRRLNQTFEETPFWSGGDINSKHPAKTLRTDDAGGILAKNYCGLPRQILVKKIICGLSKPVTAWAIVFMTNCCLFYYKNQYRFHMLYNH